MLQAADCAVAGALLLAATDKGRRSRKAGDHVDAGYGVRGVGGHPADVQRADLLSRWASGLSRRSHILFPDDSGAAKSYRHKGGADEVHDSGHHDRCHDHPRPRIRCQGILGRLRRGVRRCVRICHQRGDFGSRRDQKPPLHHDPRRLCPVCHL